LKGGFAFVGRGMEVVLLCTHENDFHDNTMTFPLAITLEPMYIDALVTVAYVFEYAHTIE
jgi:hypothetical protein